MENQSLDISIMAMGLSLTCQSVVEIYHIHTVKSDTLNLVDILVSMGILESLDPGLVFWTRKCWTLDRYFWKYRPKSHKSGCIHVLILDLCVLHHRILDSSDKCGLVA